MYGLARQIGQTASIFSKAVYEPLPKKRNGKSAAEYLHQQLLKKYDPTGKRTALVSGPERIRTGDVIKVTYLDRSTVLGRVLGVKRGVNNVGSNILIRNKISKVGCEIRIPLFNPEIKNIEIVQKPEKYLPRNKQYYIRNTKYDVGDLERGSFLFLNKEKIGKKREQKK
ncbi:hypothetical protein METBIDRAFT_79382 [Metschnikowia bicuspidata var. bicuspidata NRRL YB-4993]|uniref:Ribosomal protein L19 n=1 Tax=Metschnikowia bicuspidata var. bicuspidata NRRL YB-4993 TaxID=869754 RepID=A0A1A0H7T0_9ASCO|nr:hypothetical protein METBIDRAFT_79382 [Metschnikowia bicuspidata var. bicuspidata NRRL YB-4993]OBA20081.1 hypothetical protein METBIDRAFT_79382 [Metschnikowia bicuspidata var. bicuspidata NRRL YB-4993]